MSKAKNHHYVPQFYLRFFSEDKKSVSLLNKKRDRIISRAPIRGQCALENFHAWHEEVERHISEIEDKTAPIIRSIAETGNLPSLGSDGHLLLSVFVSLQLGRTQSVAKESDELTDRFAKTMMAGDPKFSDIDLESFRVGDKYPIALPIVTSMRAYDKILDLDIRVLEANKKLFFATSDNPVIRYNSARRHVWWEGVTGLECDGLQLFLPLSSRFMLYMQDRKCYKSPNHKEVIRLTIEETVKLNVLTILNSDQNIYGLCKSHLVEIQKLRKITKPYEGWLRMAFVETEEYPSEDGNRSSLIINYRPHPPANFEFRFAKCRKGVSADGIRGRPNLALRRKSLPLNPNAKRMAVKVATISQPRALLEPDLVKQFTKKWME